jgi:hypothetical protein
VHLPPPLFAKSLAAMTFDLEKAGHQSVVRRRQSVVKEGRILDQRMYARLVGDEPTGA